MIPNLTDARIGVIGLDYAGLPLAVSFAAKFDVLGFDINEQHICVSVEA